MNSICQAYPVNVAGSLLGEIRPQTPLTVPVPTPGTAVQFTSTAGTWASQVTVVAIKTGRVANTGTVFIWPLAGANLQVIPIAVGGVFQFVIPDGAKVDLSKWYVDAGTIADGIVVYYSI